MRDHTLVETTIELPAGLELQGLLQVPEHAAGLVLFVHGSGSSRFSSRNAQVLLLGAATCRHRRAPIRKQLIHSRFVDDE